MGKEERRGRISAPFFMFRRFLYLCAMKQSDRQSEISSPVLHLQRQQLLLRMEYEYEKAEFQRQTETMGVERKVKRGLCWWPVAVGRNYYNSLNQLVLEVTRTEDTDIEHAFEFGRSVVFFRRSLTMRFRSNSE